MVSGFRFGRLRASRVRGVGKRPRAPGVGDTGTFAVALGSVCRGRQRSARGDASSCRQRWGFSPVVGAQGDPGIIISPACIVFGVWSEPAAASSWSSVERINSFRKRVDYAVPLIHVKFRKIGLLIALGVA